MAQSREGQSRRGDQSSSEKESLKAREYRDEEGNVHHHTKKYMEEHGESEDSSRSSRGSQRGRGSER